LIGDSEVDGARRQMGTHMDMGPPYDETPARASHPTHRRLHLPAACAKDSATVLDLLTISQDLQTRGDRRSVPYFENIPQDVFHFANKQRPPMSTTATSDLTRPGSLLYEKKTFGGGYKLWVLCLPRRPTTLPSSSTKLFRSASRIGNAHTTYVLPAE